MRAVNADAVGRTSSLSRVCRGGVLEAEPPRKAAPLAGCARGGAAVHRAQLRARSRRAQRLRKKVVATEGRLGSVSSTWTQQLHPRSALLGAQLSLLVARSGARR